GAHVLANCRRAVPLEGRAPELRGVRSGDTQPEPLGGIDIGALMDLDLVDQPVFCDACGPEEAQEQADERRVAVREDHPVAPAVGLVLSAFTPVGDCSGDNDLPLGQLADLGRGGRACRLSLRLADGSLGGPVAADAVCGPLAALLVTQA